MALFSRWTVSKLGLTFAGQSTSNRAKAFFDCALTFRTTTLPWIFPNLNCFADQSSEKKKGISWWNTLRDQLGRAARQRQRKQSTPHFLAFYHPIKRTVSPE